MKMRAFNAVCPVEIGDVLYTRQDVAGKIACHIEKACHTSPTPTAYWVGEGIAKAQIITDIAAVHYVKSGKVDFLYELDNSGNYEPIKLYYIRQTI